MGAGSPEGRSAARAGPEAFAEVFAGEEFQGSLEAAFLLKQTGIPVAAWTRDAVPQEVVSVMAATMWGSLDTMIRTLGGNAPRSALLEVEDRRIFVRLVEPNWTLLLVAPDTVGKRRLRHMAQDVLVKVSRAREPMVPRRPVLVQE